MIPNHVNVKLLRHDAKIPECAIGGSAGYDIYAAEDRIVPPREWIAVPSGIAISIPKGYYGKIEPRSGLAFHRGIDTLAGVIDAGFTGEIQVILMNNDADPFLVHTGDRIAQIVFIKHESPQLIQVDDLGSTTERGEGGLGSTGTGVLVDPADAYHGMKAATT